MFSCLETQLPPSGIVCVQAEAVLLQVADGQSVTDHDRDPVKRGD